MGNQHGRRHAEPATPPRSNSFSGSYERTRHTPNKVAHPAHRNGDPSMIGGRIKHKLDASKMQFKYSLHLDNDPSDREYVVQCPTCGRELFDNGLSPTLKCPRCRTEFDSESRRMFKQKKRKTTTAKHERFSLEPAKIGTLYGPDAEDIMEPAPFQRFPLQKPKLETRLTQHKMSSSQDGGESLQNVNIMEEEEETKEIGQPPARSRVPLEIDDDDLLEDDEEEEPWEENKSDYSGDCSDDEHSEEETNSDASEESKESQQQQLASSWAYFRKLQPLELPQKEIVHLQLFCNKATLIQDFLDKKEEPRSQLIIEKLLVPFFQIKSRVVSKGLFFKIGDLEFYVANCVPESGGKVTSKTVLHPPLVTGFDQHVETLRLITTRRLHEHKSFVLKNTLIPYFKENQCLLYSNGAFVINGGEFYVRYCRPQFGIVDEHTEIRLEASTLKEVGSVNILPIWNDEAHFKEIDRQGHACYQGGYKEMLMLEFIVPYFLDAGQRKYVERGDTYRIGEINFYINGCNPKSGVVGRQTHLELERGITKATFHRKIVMADQRIAERLQCREDIIPVQEIDVTHLLEMAEGGASHPEHNFQRYLRAQWRAHQEDPSAQPRVRHPQFSLQPRGTVRAGRGGRHTNHRNGMEIENRLDHIAHMISQIQQNLHAPPQAMLQGMPLGRVNQFPTRVTDRGYIERQKKDFLEKKVRGERMEYEDMDENPNLTCMICLMQYEEGDECRTLPCIHYFHKRCIDNWLERGSTCPICKLNLLEQEGGAD